VLDQLRRTALTCYTPYSLGLSPARWSGASSSHLPAALPRRARPRRARSMAAMPVIGFVDLGSAVASAGWLARGRRQGDRV